MTDAACQRAAAERNHKRVELRSTFQQFEADRSGSLASAEVQAVLDQMGALVFSDGAGEQSGVLDVVARQPDPRPGR
jgi:Ca2+-binding EF-hand superfamily protein